MLPIRVVGKTSFRAYTTFTLLVVYVSFFAWEIFLTATGHQAIETYLPHYALSVCEIGRVPTSEVLLDSMRGMFMSTSFMQVLVNLLFLWLFGPLVEQFLGFKRFLTLFVFAGLGGYALSVLFTPESACDVLYGPNGAIAGMIGAFVLLYPVKRIETYLRIVIDRKFDLPAVAFVLIYLGLQFLAADKGPLSGDLAPVWDEIGGFIVGALFIVGVTMFKAPPKASPLDHLDD